MKEELGERLQRLFKRAGITKPCEGCQRRAELLNEAGRRGFIKGSLFLAGMLLIPFKEALALGSCLWCVNRNATGYWICLQCDTTCSNCSNWTTCDCCIWNNEQCNGQWTTYALCCRSGQCSPSCIEQDNSSKAKMPVTSRWEIVLNDGGKFELGSSDDNLDPIAWFNSRVKVTDRRGNKFSAEQAHKL